MVAKTVMGVKKIVGWGTKVTVVARGLGNALNNTNAEVLPPMQNGYLTLMGGETSIAIAEGLVEGVDFKYRVKGGNDWEIEFLKDTQTVAYNG